MPWWQESDTFADDPRWEVLAGGNLDRLDRLQAAYSRLMSRAAHLLSNGYLTDRAALRECHNRRQILELLATSVLDEPPWLHRKGDVCDCLGDDWTTGYEFRIHRFLKKNPSRAEYNRNTAQKADRRSAELRGRVCTRDGGCCRYCRSGPLSPKANRARDRRKVLHFDHIDPDRPAGADASNYAVACGLCSEYKGRRTPDEADMVLLPVPTPDQIGYWNDRGPALFYRGDQHADQTPNTPRSGAEQKQIKNTSADPISDPNTDRNSEQNNDHVGEPRPEHGDHHTDQPRGDPGNHLGSGRGGKPPDPLKPFGHAQPARAPDSPDIYHHRSRGPAPPPFIWPQGATPDRPTQTAEGDTPS